MIRPAGFGTRGKPGALMTSDPRQQRINRQFHIIDQIASKLNINQSIRDMGHNYHKLASIHKNSNQKNLKDNKFKSLTQGRNTKVVAAACLYMACRIQKSPHLLIDFSDAI